MSYRAEYKWLIHIHTDRHRDAGDNNTQSPKLASGNTSAKFMANFGVNCDATKPRISAINCWHGLGSVKPSLLSHVAFPTPKMWAFSTRCAVKFRPISSASLMTSSIIKTHGVTELKQKHKFSIMAVIKSSTNQAAYMIINVLYHVTGLPYKAGSPTLLGVFQTRSWVSFMYKGNGQP